MPRQREFVLFIASVMAINALGIDLVLPAFPALRGDLGIVDASSLQAIVTFYALGFGVGQLIYGPLADRFGRKPVLLFTLAGFAAASVAAGQAATLPVLLAARAAQGLMSASTRVLAVAMVRDRYKGSEMAKVLSLAQMTFFVVPILAPALGQGLLFVGSWRFLFVVLAATALVVFVWSARRVPETLPVELRRAISPKLLADAYGQVLSNRASICYTAANALTYGAIITFISLAQQVFEQVFHIGAEFTLIFAICALAMSLASLFNSRVVERFGALAISRTAVTVLTAISLLHVGVVVLGLESLTSFVVFQSLSMACISLAGANFGALAMQPLGHLAGTASSLQSFVSSAGGVVISVVIGHMFGIGTAAFAFGYLGIGVAATILAIVARSPKNNVVLSTR